MKLTILHDSQGNIAALLAYPSDAPPAYMETKAGQRVTELEVSDPNVELGDQTIYQHLADLAQTSRVEVDSKAKLTKK